MYTYKGVHRITCAPIQEYTFTPGNLSTFTSIKEYGCSQDHLYICKGVHLQTLAPVHLPRSTAVHKITCTPWHLYTYSGVHMYTYTRKRLLPYQTVQRTKVTLLTLYLHRESCVCTDLSVTRLSSV